MEVKGCSILSMFIYVSLTVSLYTHLKYLGCESKPVKCYISVFTWDVFSAWSDVWTGNLWFCETRPCTFQRTSGLLSLVTRVVCEIQTTVTDRAVYIPERSSRNVKMLSGGLESVKQCTSLQMYVRNIFCTDINIPKFLETIRQSINYDLEYYQFAHSG